MLDTMTLTKVVASICGAFLILLLGKWAAEGLYHVGGHGDEQAYAIEVEETGGAGEEVAEAVPFPVIYAAASAEAGEGLWRGCQSCHKLEAGANGVGPYLYGVVGRDKGSAQGYAYSEVLATMEGAWTPENLDGFLASPKDYAPGTKMSYAGMKDAEDRANLIAYLNTFEGNAPPESYADAAAAAAAPTEEAATEEAPTEEAATEEAATEEATTEEAATEEVASAEATTEEAVTEETTTEEATTEEAATEEAATEEVASAEATTEEAVTEEATTEEATTEEAATEEAATEEPATEEATTEEAAAGGDSEFAAAFAAADAGAGERLWRQCASCHKLEDGARGAGPHLYGVIGRDIASVEGFRYSDALTGLEGDWTPEKLSGWLENPKEYAPGNRMSFRGLPELQDRANLIAYIEANGG